MIPVANAMTQIDELPGEEIAFGIGDPRWVMKTQADLYSDITTAIIREYSTNAYDAHVMAGNPDPIQVTLPSVMNPYFIVEDKGVGMDMETFRSVYTQFGVSDKRTSNDTNGMLGYGSKSGVAYTTSFEVTSIRNGMKIHGVVLRKPDWSIVLKVVAQTRTNEPNGTKIVIPVHNVEEFVTKANNFYEFWLPGRVLVNGAEPKHNVGEKIVDGLYYSPNYLNSYVVMGNVPYRINNPSALFYNVSMRSINFVSYVDNGDVEFTPSREDLAYTDHTKAALQKIVNDFQADIVAKAKTDLAAAKSHSEAFSVWNKWNGLVGNALGNLTYKGDAFSPYFKINARVYRPTQYRSSTYSVNQYEVVSMPTTMIVTEYDYTMSSKHKAMARDYAKAQGWDAKMILFTAAAENEIVSPWIPRDQIVTYATIKAATPKVVKPRNYNNPNAGRVAGSWDYYDNLDINYEGTIPACKANELFWISVQHDNEGGTKDMIKALGMDKTITIIVPANRLAKFQRENPQARSLWKVVRDMVQLDENKFLSDEAKQVLSVDYDTRKWLKFLDLCEIDDPEVSRLANLVADEDNVLKERHRNNTIAQACKMGYHIKRYEPKSEKTLYKKYPLLQSLSVYANREHVQIYLNAVHAAESEKNDG